MQLTSSFTISRPVEEVWSAFQDIERIATCMPGSKLLGSPRPDVYEGEVKVKVGPLTVKYAGELTVVSSNDETHRMKLSAKGREARGAGNAEADVVVRLIEADSGTTVRIDTDLNIQGKVAQFGRGVIGEVTDGILQAFARNVEKMLSQNAVPDASSSAEDAQNASASAGTSTSQLGAVGAETSDEDVTSDLDAWSLIIRPMLQKQGTGIAMVVVAGIAAWFGARAGVRSSLKRQSRDFGRYSDGSRF